MIDRIIAGECLFDLTLTELTELMVRLPIGVSLIVGRQSTGYSVELDA